eukprot:CAMPEP_0114126284 /NCGR_PEP_ID=MMETSP0043_2-20121206/9750_1 /TAXON_ID=464988 /ORGANISM="Hemiselmis andersenii, Strain CCMP644" /LENGTH=123 /DNA_ID=CAMNT_0001219263 /DNA_START=32 /DNA_END=403 /DNA_ORIENTATION=-
MTRATVLLAALACMVAHAAAFIAPAMPLGQQCAVQRLSASVPAARSAPAVTPMQMVDINVFVNEGEPIESALRRFKNAVSKSGHLNELRRRKRFETNKEKEIRKEKEGHRKRRMAKMRNQPQF